MSRLPKAPLNPRKQARQARASATVDAIVEGAARILQSEGAAALTTNRIAEVAGVSVGSLYQYFPNKQAIVVALIEAQLGRDEQIVEGLVQAEHPDLRTALATTLSVLCEHQYRLAPLLKQLLPQLSPLQQEALVRQRVQQLAQRFDRTLLRYLTELRPALHDPVRRSLALNIMTDAVRGALNATTLADAELLRTAAFQSDLVNLALGLLQAEPTKSE